MLHLLDILLVALLVIVSVTYTLYALGSIRIKRRMLEWLIRCFGLRAYTLLSPRLGGCHGCSEGAPKHSLSRTLQSDQQGSKSLLDQWRRSGRG